MYGTMEDMTTDARPLLNRDEGRVSNLQGRTSVSANPDAGGRRGMKSRPSLQRSGAVLKSILNKPHHHTELGTTTANAQISTLDLSPTDQSAPQEIQKKSFIYTMLNPRSDAVQAVAFKWFITVVIVADLVSFVISTEPDLSERTQDFFHAWEGVTSSIFLIEYIARLIVVTEAKKYGERGWFWGRVRYLTTYSALIDFAATFPFFLELSTGWDLPTLTYLRSFRLLRILRTSGFAEATNAVYRVIYYNRQILYVALLICIGLVLVTAVLMYYLRPQDPAHSQEFKSLGSTIYLSTLMLTGQGGPDGDMPWYTRGVVLMTGVFSIGMFAIPASMLTWGFEAEAERIAKLTYMTQQSYHAATENDNWSFTSDDYSTDEEYRRIITGGDESEEDPDEEARKDFSLADIDGSGNISLTEYLRMSREQTEKDRENLSATDGRFAKLESRVEENSKKLDRICQLLESMQEGKKK